MKHARKLSKTVPLPTMEYSLLESVYAIIDSRIQFLEYQNDKLFRSYLKKGEEDADVLHLNLNSGPRSLLNNFEDLLGQIAKSSRSVKLLLFLRTHLLTENARLVLDLLTSDKYLNYSEDTLNQMLALEEAA
ncbi:MAG: hypothetical protein AAGG75_00205 [Bacteroidota bacterium]